MKINDHDGEKQIEALKQEALYYKKLFHKASVQLAAELAENMVARIDLKNKNDLLEEKIRHLGCLNQISKCIEDEGLSLDQMLQKIVDLIGPAFQCPENISVEIKYKDRIYRSENFDKKGINPQQVLISENVNDLVISILCNSSITNTKKNPLSEEEKQLLATIANNLGQILYQNNTERRMQMLQSAINQSPFMISFVNFSTGIIEYVNPAFINTFGMKSGDLMKDEFYNSVSFEETSVIEKEAGGVVFGSKGLSKTYRNQKSDGTHFWQKMSLYPYVENGKVTHILSVSEDMSDEIRAAEELEVAKENYKHIAQNVPEPILIAKKDGSLLYANNKASEVTGYSNVELLNISLKELIHPKDFVKTKNRLAARLVGREVESEFEARIITKNGEIKILEASGSKTKWIDELADLVLLNDVTESRRLQNLLKIQDKIDYLSSIPAGLEKSLKGIFDSLFEFKYIDGGGIYLEKDDGLKLIFHRGLSEAFVKANQFAPVGSGQYRIIMRAKTQYFNFSNPQSSSLQFRKEGIKSLFVIPLFHDGRMLGALNLASRNEALFSENEKMIFESIGKRIAQTIALIYVQEKLLTKNTELQKTLEEIHEKQHLLVQKSKLESLGEMSAGIAHEINQPLGIILLSLENILIKMSAKKATQKYLDEKFDSIFNNINKIKSIIDHIRTFSHDQKSLIIERIDLNKVVTRSCSLINEQYKYHNILINLDLGQDIGYALGNNQKMEQVIFNLLSNAKYALEEKEALPNAYPFEKAIQIRTFSDNKKVYVEIRDNGIGIDKENLDNIYNPFFTTKPEGVGTGLGLSIVYGIITDMKGKITIESKRNEYTLVRIELLSFKFKN